ncbi:MAG: hypothetical protein R3B72_49910 [Polyangiaceae bacterium]
MALDRLAGDVELFEELMWHGFTGPTWDRFARACAEYALSVMTAWCLNGRVFVQSARKGFGGLRHQDLKLDRDDAVELASETIAVALQRFRDHVLIPRRWDPTQGASIKTYFIGQCLLRFPNVFARWRRERRKLPRGDVSTETASTASPELVVRVQRGLRRIKKPKIRDIIVMRAKGHTRAEIAKATGQTLKGVDGHLGRLKKGESW